MAETAIEWATDTWNPTTGCDRVSPGCAHCYALELAPKLRRFAQARERKAIAEGKPHTPGKWLGVRDGGKASGPAFGLTLHPDVLDLPLRQTRPRTYFVNSMSDLFHEEVPWTFVAEVFAVMSLADQHTFQVLTKRPHRMRAFLSHPMFWLHLNATRMQRGYAVLPGGMSGFADQSEAFPIPQVWLGVSIENRAWVHRADELRATPATVRFISAEPLLGPLVHDSYFERCEGAYGCWADGHESPELDLAGIDWLIAGGESGTSHRPVRAEWVRDLRDACAASGTAFFFKQWGGAKPKSGGRLLDGRTWDEMPRTAAREVTHVHG